MFFPPVSGTRSAVRTRFRGTDQVRKAGDHCNSRNNEGYAIDVFSCVSVFFPVSKLTLDLFNTYILFGDFNNRDENRICQRGKQYRSTGGCWRTAAATSRMMCSRLETRGTAAG